MINLLNVVLEEDKNHLVEMSQEAMQKMMAPTPPAFEYDDLINDKAQIVFRKTTSDKEEDSEQKSEDEEDEEEVEGTIESFQSSRIEVGGGNIASPVDRAL